MKLPAYLSLSPFVAVLLLAPMTWAAQSSRPASPLDATTWGVVYDVPAAKYVRVEQNVPYLQDAKGTLAVDFYLHPGATKDAPRPAVVFVNAIGDSPDSKLKDWAIYTSWPRLVAAHGLVGISMEADPARVRESLVALFRFLEQHGIEHGVNPTRIGVYAASANVTGASEYLMGKDASKAIRAAAFYYGRPPDQQLRADLPVLFIFAESDLQGQKEPLVSLWQRVVETRAPWSMVFASGLPHAFDAFADNDESRRLIQQTIAFWKSNLEPMPETARARSDQPEEGRSILASLYAHEPEKAAGLLARWTAEHPDDAQGFRHYGRVLAELNRFPEARTAYERAMALGADDPGTLAGMAQVLVGNREWKKAVPLLKRAAAGGGGNSLVYGLLGVSQLQLGKNEEAVQNYEKAFEVGMPPGPNTRGVSWYNLACGYVRLGKEDKAFEALGKSIDEGFGTRTGYEGDTDLAPLRNDPRYQKLLERLDSRASETERASGAPGG